MPAQEHIDPFATVQGGQRRTTNSLPSILQFGDFPLEAPIRATQPRGTEESAASEKVSLASVRDEVPSSQTANGLGIDMMSTQTKETLLPKPSSSQPSMPAPSTVAGLNLASTRKSLPLLSPVREVSTPLPTAVRGSNGSAVEALKKSSHGRSNSLTGDNKPSSSLTKVSTTSQTARGKAAESREYESSGTVNGSRAKGSQQTSPAPSTSQQAQVSGWQQSTNKKSKKNRKAGSVGSLPLMVGEGERKGG